MTLNVTLSQFSTIRHRQISREKFEFIFESDKSIERIRHVARNVKHCWSRK